MPTPANAEEHSGPVKMPDTPYTGPRHTLKHPQLGELSGRCVTSPHFPTHRVVQFRSIPYATVPKRFSPAHLLADIPRGFDSRPHRDFTTFGAACPQLGAAHPAWYDPYGGPLEDDLGLVFDEFTCLTVSISVPEAHLVSEGDTRKCLPVMVYIHGGGLQEGAGHVDGLHSNAHLTACSAAISQPVITVNVGYRVNWLGSLVCTDMLDEYEVSDPATRSPLGPFNLSLQDQRLAFLWIQKFIHGFGGDDRNITAFGESAGSISLIYHICGSSVRLFDRAVLQSGTILGHSSFEAKETEYQAILKHFHIDHGTPAERLSALRQVDAGALAQYPGAHVAPYVGSIPGVSCQDSLFTKGPPTVASQMDLIPACEWLGDIMVGDVFWEGQIFLNLLKDCPQSRFAEIVGNIFPKKEAEALLAAYEIPSTCTTSIEPNRARMQMSLLLGDVAFSADYHTLSRVLASTGKGRNVYRYHFALSNPFPGSLHSFNTGHHFVEILFLFLTLLDRYPTHRDHWHKRQACETARRWITFANGRAPWDAYTVTDAQSEKEAKIAVCDDIAGWTLRTVEEDEEASKRDPWGPRRYAGWRAIAAAYDAIRARVPNERDYSNEVARVKPAFLQIVFGSLIEVPKSGSLGVA